MDQCLRAMRQGGDQFSEALSDQNGAGAQPLCWPLLALMITSTIKRPQKIKHITQALVQHPDFPGVDPDEGASVMQQTLKQDPSFSAVPLLHAAGFTLMGTDEEYEVVANLVAKGQWPHVELIAPGIFHEKAHFAYLKMGLSRKELLLNPAKMQALRHITPSTGFAHQLSQSLGYCVGQLLPEFSNPQYQNLIQTLSIYRKSGFLHTGIALQIAISDGYEKEMRQIISEIDRHQLRGNTLKASHPIRPRRI